MFQLQNIVVKDIFTIDNLTLKEDIIAVIGQSGSGKSTLLRLLNNLDDATSGIILFNGRKLTDFSPQNLRRKIVMVPQNSVIFDGTIRENLLIGLKFSKQKTIEDQVLIDMLHSFLIDKTLDTDASELSGGEQQRLTLVRILLMGQAEVFLLDEPTSELDDKTTEHVMQQLIKLVRNNEQKIIMITHNKQVAKKYSNKIINMDKYNDNIESS